jgi:uncharacterized membrane protein YphA (DoxX/SURF4 family)
MTTAFQQNAPFASFLARWIVGLLFLMAGYWKVFVLTAQVHAQNFFVNDFSEHWIPSWLLWVLGLAIPYIELAIGVLVCIGFRTREALMTMGLLLIATTYGHALHTPLFDIDGHTFTRLSLILFVLLLGWEKDKTTIDYWLNQKHSKSTR